MSTPRQVVTPVTLNRHDCTYPRQQQQSSSRGGYIQTVSASHVSCYDFWRCKSTTDEAQRRTPTHSNRSPEWLRWPKITFNDLFIYTIKNYQIYSSNYSHFSYGNQFIECISQFAIHNSIVYCILEQSRSRMQFAILYMGLDNFKG